MHTINVKIEANNEKFDTFEHRMNRIDEIVTCGVCCECSTELYGCEHDMT